MKSKVDFSVVKKLQAMEAYGEWIYKLTRSWPWNYLEICG
jgi:hypothetical protein